MRDALKLILTTALVAIAAPAVAAPLHGTKVELDGKFDGSDKVRKSTSGIACAPPIGDSRQCLVALDEKLNAQWAILTLGDQLTLTVSDTVALFDKDFVDPLDLPLTDCPGGLDDDADEADSEGVAFANDTFYLTGSHGCGRTSGSYRTSTFIDVRLGLPGSGDGIDTSIRLNPTLADLFGDAYGTDIENGAGVTIEGIAASKTMLYFGLRSPVTDGTAYIVPVKANKLFDTGQETLAQTAIEVPFGQEVGIRDLAVLDDAGPTLLILAGPVAGEGSSAAIWLLDLGKHKLLRLSEIEPASGGKPEGMLLADRTGDDLRILVLHDGLKDGRPTEYDIHIPAY